MTMCKSLVELDKKLTGMTRPMYTVGQHYRVQILFGHHDWPFYKIGQVTYV